MPQIALCQHHPAPNQLITSLAHIPANSRLSPHRLNALPAAHLFISRMPEKLDRGEYPNCGFHHAEEWTGIGALGLVGISWDTELLWRYWRRIGAVQQRHEKPLSGTDLLLCDQATVLSALEAFQMPGFWFFRAVMPLSRMGNGGKVPRKQPKYAK